MFNSESDKTYCNLFCLLVFIIVILCLNSFLPLLVITIYFYLLTSHKSNYLVITLYVLTFIGLACGLLNVFGLFKLILIIDYIYYFMAISNFKTIFIDYDHNKNKLIKKNVTNNYTELNNDEGEINLIDSSLYDDNLALVGTNDEINYFRFKNYSVRKLEKFSFSYANGLYLCFHLFILLVSVVLM